MSKHEFSPTMIKRYGENPWLSYHDRNRSPYSHYPRIKMEYGMKALPELDPTTGPFGGFSTEQNIMRKVIGKPSEGRHRKDDEEE